MLLYLIGIFIFGCFVGTCLRNSQIKRAAKNKEVITIDGIIYSVKRWEE